MPKSIQIRDVPDEVHATLRARAALAGLSLSDYLRLELMRQTERPTLEEVLARIDARARVDVSKETIVAAIRAGRDGYDLL